MAKNKLSAETMLELVIGGMIILLPLLILPYLKLVILLYNFLFPSGVIKCINLP